MEAKNHNITWLQLTSQTEIMSRYQLLDSRERGKRRLERNSGPPQVSRVVRARRFWQRTRECIEKLTLAALLARLPTPQGVCRIALSATGGTLALIGVVVREMPKRFEIGI
jgi:hypothetical protein